MKPTIQDAYSLGFARSTTTKDTWTGKFAVIKAFDRIEIGGKGNHTNTSMIYIHYRRSWLRVRQIFAPICTVTGLAVAGLC